MKKIILPLMMALGAYTQHIPEIQQDQKISREELEASPEFQDPNFLRIINNYFGCKTWVDGVCMECSNNFYFNENGVCCEVKEFCK